MPDSEGYLDSDEVLINGEVWRVQEIAPRWKCEWDGDAVECEELAVVELTHFEHWEEGGTAYRLLCVRHFEKETGQPWE